MALAEEGSLPQQTSHPPSPTYNNLVLSGGAFKAIAFIGCIRYLEDNNLISYIQNVIGSSAGAIIGLMVCLDYSSNDMISIIKKESSQYDDTIDIDSILDMFDTMGASDGQEFVEMAYRIMQYKLSCETFSDSEVRSINFANFAKKTGKNMVIAASNLSKAQSEYFSVDTTPTLTILQAIRISISVPIIMTPVIMNDMVYVDAGIFNNFPIEYFDDQRNPFTNTLSLLVSSPLSNTPVNSLNLISYVKLLFDSLLTRNNTKHESAGKGNHSVYVDLKEGSQTYGIDMQTMKMEINDVLIDKYIEIGYESLKLSYIR